MNEIVYGRHKESFKDYFGEEVDSSRIGGNATAEAKKHIAVLFRFFRSRSLNGFADSVGESVAIVSVDVEKFGKKNRPRSTVICECTVTEDMTNGVGTLHGGCSIYLLDVCSTLPIAAALSQDGEWGTAGVTQSIQVVYHSPAVVGTRLEIISHSVGIGARTMSARCEIWDKGNKRLVASGVHTKMNPSSPKL